MPYASKLSPWPAWFGRGVLVLLFVLALPPSARAAPAEIRVFTDELLEPGQRAVELHLNTFKPPATSPLAPNQPVQAMVELSYGLAPHWELSLQLPASQLEGIWAQDGLRAELKYIAPHDDDEGPYWGFNVEFGYLRSVGEPYNWGLELIPIWGWRQGPWHWVVNPGINVALSGDERRVMFQPAGKVAYHLGGHHHIGVEYYVEAGPLSAPLARQQRSEIGFLVWDGKLGKTEFNLGLGRGWTGASDDWVVKLIVQFPLR